MFRSISFRLAALYTGLFTITVVTLGAGVLLSTGAAMGRQFDVRITAETAGLVQEYRVEGMADVIEAVHERELTPGALEYGLNDPQGRPVAGRLAGLTTKRGWAFAVVHSTPTATERVRILTTDLPNGYRLFVGEDLDRIEVLDTLVLKSFALTLLGVILVGGVVGYAFSRDLGRRFGAISTVADEIIGGKMSSRVAMTGSGDELDRLAGSLNRMLDRIDQLMESLRQVSNDIAHDLRTPLTRLRQRLEAMAAEEPERERVATIEAAVSDLDSVLETFAAMLRIAETENGARRAGFRQLDLAALAQDVVDGLDAVAEEAGQSLVFRAEGPVEIEGDGELLTQLIVNLVENAITHTPRGSRIEVSAGEEGAAALLRVVDNGPGVPAGQYPRLFERFYRLERSRSTPGSGLGMALVAAIARLHEAEIELRDAGPGLEVRLKFRRAAS